MAAMSEWLQSNKGLDHGDNVNDLNELDLLYDYRLLLKPITAIFNWTVTLCAWGVAGDNQRQFFQMVKAVLLNTYLTQALRYTEDTTSIRQATIGKVSIGQASVGQV